ncbi:MAG: ABC transporter permease [Candidatus Limivivens sp.]|nr:ABC transporter permease [Candidatus Limivivens sp.]
MTYSENKKKRRKENRADTWKLFRKNKAAVIGLVILIIFVLVALFADLITPYENAIAQNPKERLMAPCTQHWFGTDEFGRDLFARVIHGSRRSLSLGVGTTLVSLLIGGFIGACCGIYGSRFDSIVMRICDILNCIPSLLFALAVVAALGSSMTNLLIAVTVISIPGFIRIVRSVILSITEQEYIMAARACDSSNLTIIRKHIIPNAMGPIIIQASMSVASMMLTAAGLSFIGMGVQPPTPEWGVMLSTAREYMKSAPYLLLFPGVSIALSALALNLVGDGLRDALDPKMKQ